MNKSVVLNLLCALSLGVFAHEPLRPSVGTDDFQELVTQSGTFIDKTLLIRDILLEKDKVILITRPRRWGKLVNMNMLKYFFKEEVNAEGERLEPKTYRYLFENLKISQEPGFVDNFQGRYPVILMTLKGVKNHNFQEMKTALESTIVRLFSDYKYVSPISHWWEESGMREDIFLKKIREEVIDNKNIGFKNSLKTLSKWLHQHHGKKVYVLIDEYDTPAGRSHSKNWHQHN